MRVFLYGSLMRGEPAEWRMAGCEFVEEAETTAGFALLDLGDYPGMIRGGPGTVTGEVWEVPPQALPGLDEYEDHPVLYLRQEIVLANGSRVQAWLYCDPEAPALSIPSGNWREHLAGRRGTI